MYIGYKVWKIIKFNNHILLSMIITVNLTCISNEACSIFTIVSAEDNTPLDKLSPYVLIINIVPVVLSLLELEINLNIWVRYQYVIKN